MLSIETGASRSWLLFRPRGKEIRRIWNKSVTNKSTATKVRFMEETMEGAQDRYEITKSNEARV